MALYLGYITFNFFIVQLKNMSSSFIGRKVELSQFENILRKKEASVITIYGRRRVGKTTLIEKFFSSMGMIKCEGIEGGHDSEQRRSMLEQYAEQTNNSSLKHVETKSWRELLRIISEGLGEGRVTLYLEEFQWLSNYKSELIAEIKYFWDNYWKNNDEFTLILCGSSPSFMASKVVHSKAMYNRSLHEFSIEAFSAHETKEFLGDQCQALDAMNALLLVGGIPEYLKYLKEESSLYLALAKNSFTANGFFKGEYERIFVSSLENNPHYKKILHFLSTRSNATRDEIAKHLSITSGGNLTEVLEDLALCHFISRYTPFDKGPSSLLARYEISDPYLEYYYRYIEPKLEDIQHGRYREHPLKALPIQSLEQWLGYSLERYCRRHAHHIADHLGFGAVEYQSGAFYSRATTKEDRGFQIDLLFKRADRVVTLCEVKYNSSPITMSSARKILETFAGYSVPRSFKTQRVLITTGGVSESVRTSMMFDEIISPVDIFF